MRFCTACGSRLPEGTKFCPECGQKVVAMESAPVQQPNETPAQQTYEAPAQQTYEAPAPQAYEAPAQQTYEAPAQQTYEAPAPQTYEAPAQQTYEAPAQQTYEAPAQQTYEAPAPQTYEAPAPQTYEAPAQQTYTAPAQQTYEAPAQQTYTAPAQQTYEAPAQQTYTAPAQQTYTAPAQQAYTAPPQQTNTQPTYASGGVYAPPAAQQPAAKQKKTGGSGKVGLFIGIGVAAVLLVVAVVLAVVLMGKGKADDPNLGRYEGVSCVVSGIDLGAEDEWIELKAGGKADVYLMGTKYSAKWSLDGENFVLKQGGDNYTGTLKNGVITVDFAGMVYTFARSGGSPAPGGNTQNEVAGYWTLQRVDSDDPDACMSEEDVALFKTLGIELFLDLKADGTGAFMFFEPVKITWGDGKITMGETGETIAYTMTDDLLQIEIEGGKYTFVRGEGEAPVIDWQAYTDDEDPKEASTEASTVGAVGAYDWWDGDWYGWVIISDGNEPYSESIGSYEDCVATVSVFSDDTGYITLSFTDGEELGWASVSFGPGTTDYGCMMSEDGSVLGGEIAHADWIIDPGASEVSTLDQMICIQSTVYDEDGDWFEYSIYMRPWGMEWEDVRNADTNYMPYDDMMPRDYDGWYLPQITGSASVAP